MNQPLFILRFQKKFCIPEKFILELINLNDLNVLMYLFKN